MSSIVDVLGLGDGGPLWRMYDGEGSHQREPGVPGRRESTKYYLKGVVLFSQGGKGAGKSHCAVRSKSYKKVRSWQYAVSAW